MAEHCMVIAGEWKTSADSHWNFSIDKDHMTRIVPLRIGIPLTELLSNVFKEFFDNSDVIRTAVLSYWPPNTKELATGLTTPPVMLTNDGAVSYFYQHFQANKGMNLFVTFKTPNHTAPVSHVDENPLPFTMPNQPIKRPHSPYSSSALRHPSTAGSQIPGFSLFNDDEILSQSCAPVQPKTCPPVHPTNYPSVLPSNCPPVHPQSCPPVQLKRSQIPGIFLTNDNNLDHQFATSGGSGPSKSHRFSLIDETLFCGDELLENMFKEDPDNIPDSWVTEDEETASDTSLPPDIDDVQPRGYDQDFWSPLIDDHLGGSDAPEVMAGITVPKTAPHIIHCTTGDAFDHTVLVSGELPPYCKPEIGASSTHVHPKSCPPVQIRSCPPGRRLSTSICSARTSYSDNHQPHPSTPLLMRPDLYQISVTRNLTSHPCLMIPCSNLKMFRTWISMTMNLALGNCMHQSKTVKLASPSTQSRNSFTSAKPEPAGIPLSSVAMTLAVIGESALRSLPNAGTTLFKSVSWTIVARLTLAGFTRSVPPQKVLAHIYRSKYGDPTDAPKAVQLQQLVLEDLRVSASYMKCHRAKGIALDITHGNAEDSYLHIAGYFDRLVATNPGTVTDIQTELDVEGNTRFLYAFLSFGVSIQGFRRLRPVLIIDGTHLSGNYKGVLLTASGQDGNFQVFPLAFAVVDGEIEEAWTWFLTKLEKIIADSNTLTIISDRHVSIVKAKSQAFPKAHHGACIVHLMRNVVSRYKSRGLAKMVCEAAFSFRRSDFDANF
ncbi:hypothetical protein Bca101_082617 [Brassica carinata]